MEILMAFLVLGLIGLGGIAMFTIGAVTAMKIIIATVKSFFKK